jgi:hypothetical protein
MSATTAFLTGTERGDMTMTRKFSIALVVLAALAITVGSAFAANPHYVGPKTPTYSIDSSTGSLWVNFKAAGYGSGQ